MQAQYDIWNTNPHESKRIATSKGGSFVPLIAELPHGR